MSDAVLSDAVLSDAALSDAALSDAVLSDAALANRHLHHYAHYTGCSCGGFQSKRYSRWQTE